MGHASYNFTTASMTMAPDISEIRQTVWLDGHEEKGQ